MHLALLDPFRLGELPFSVIESLARVKRMDLLNHASARDLTRDLHNYVRTDGPKHLHRFAPRWRDHVYRGDLLLRHSRRRKPMPPSSTLAPTRISISTA